MLNIVLPLRDQFPTPDHYYITALHELAHWTGHESRSNRFETGVRESKEDYAKEKLRAEIASMMIGQIIGIGHDPPQHATYVDSWIKAFLEREVEQGPSNEARVQVQKNFYSMQLGQFE